MVAVQFKSGRTVNIVTATDVDARLLEACQSLRRLHMPGLLPSAPNKSAWPGFVRDYWEEFSKMVDGAARDEAEKKIRAQADYRAPPPNAAEIDRMDETFGWFKHVRDAEHRQAVWTVYMLKAANIHNPQRTMAARTGLHRNTIRNRVNRGIDDMAKALNVVP